MSNIEDQIKDIIINSDDKTDLIEKLCLIFPNIKQTSKNVIKQGVMDNKNEIILEEFSDNGIILYKDKVGNIWDESAELVGIFNNGKPTYLKLTKTTK